MPQLKRMTELPQGSNKAIEQAVQSFIKDSHVYLTSAPLGFYQQTLESIASATHLKGSGDFFLALDDDGSVASYALGNVSKDVDNTLVYWGTQAWVAPKYRGQPIVKEWFEVIRQRAMECFCKHIIIVSSRGDKGYCRFLGKGYHLYAHLLKEDL